MLFCLCQAGSVQLFTNSRGGPSGSISSINDVCTVNTVSYPFTQQRQNNGTPCLGDSVRSFLRQRPVLCLRNGQYILCMLILHDHMAVKLFFCNAALLRMILALIRSFFGNRSLGKFLFLAANKNFNLSYWQAPKSSTTLKRKK